MNSLVKPFYVYSCYYIRNGTLNNHSSRIISHNLKDLNKTIFRLPEAGFEVSYNIRFDYDLYVVAYQTTNVISLINTFKLNFEQFNMFYKTYQQLKNKSLFKLIGSDCYTETDNLLDLIMLNWDEWN